MSNYKDFLYFTMRKKGMWKVSYPSGWTTVVYADSEEELKTKLDEVIAMFEGENVG